MGPPITPILSILIIITTIITVHAPLFANSLPRPDRPGRISPLLSPPAEISLPPPPLPHHRHHPPPPPRKMKSFRHNHHMKRNPRHKINLGKKIGILFIGIIAVLQVVVVGFLAFKGWRIAKIKDRGTTNCSG